MKTLMTKHMLRIVTAAFIVLCAFFYFAVSTPSALAAEDNVTQSEVSTNGSTETPSDEGEDDEAPSFSNPAQAQHAAALAEAVASQPNPELEAALDAQEQAEKNLEDAKETNDEEAIKEATKELESAKEAVEQAMAESVGVTVDDIAAMREEGMGWGEIAHELGVHPGALGLGHTKGKAHHSRNAFMGDNTSNKEKNKFGTTELQEATARNVRTGWSKGHDINSGSNSMGLGHTAKSHGHGGKASSGKGGKSGGNSGGGKGNGKEK